MRLFFILLFVVVFLNFQKSELFAQTEDAPKEQQDVGEHDNSQLTDSSSKKGKRKKGKKNLDDLVEGKTQEDLEESNKTALTKEEKEYLKKKEKQKKAQKKIDEATRKRTEKIIANRQKKAKSKVKKSKKNYLDTH